MTPRNDLDRIERSTREARAAVEVERTEREAKTARLREQRLSQQGPIQGEPTPGKKRKPKAKRIVKE
ncbi:hypothetical protein DBIPINDM_008559 (plasmid) [Mesorhizobium sp. AR02]|uniref:hypothetical protein n=1 Tax=Mesorhizobium sp. AR02 TaxID=2865837 RepID=UPI00215E7268|nr:hypothetical protein [Mesorhizobium sp. AR02]UVK57298.1 hypothetical protein DBIPINDM_008559 [Mesorhizobium sp. AR02]